MAQVSGNEKWNDDSPMPIYKMNPRGVVLLFRNVILRAMKDVVLGTRPGSLQECNRVLLWIDSEDFAYVCNRADLDSQAVREQILKAYRDQRLPCSNLVEEL